MQPPPYVIFPTYEDDSFNAMSSPPLYEVEVVLRTTTEGDKIVGNENGDDSDEEDDDARDDEDLDPHWLPGEEKFTNGNLLSEDENDGDYTSSSCDSKKKYLVFDSCLTKLLKRCPDCGDVIVQHERKTIGSMLSIELTCHSGHTTNWDSQPVV